MYWWGPFGATQLGSIEESGLRVSHELVTVAPGDAVSVPFETVMRRAVRDGELALRFVPQARHVPARLEVHLDAPAWKIRVGKTHVKVDWDRTFDFRWNLELTP